MESVFGAAQCQVGLPVHELTGPVVQLVFKVLGMGTAQKPADPYAQSRPGGLLRHAERQDDRQVSANQAKT